MLIEARRPRDLLVLLVADAGCLAGKISEVEQPPAAHDATRCDLDLLEPRAVQHEGALHTHVEAHLADAERAACAGAVLLDDDPLKDLNSVLVALDDSVVDAKGITDPEIGMPGAKLGFLKGDDFRGRIHGELPETVGERHYAHNHRAVKERFGEVRQRLDFGAKQHTLRPPAWLGDWFALVLALGPAPSMGKRKRRESSMNTHPGIIGKKLGMTQYFADDGSVVRCTVIESDLTVVAKRTKELHGYDALVVGLGERKEKHTSKAALGTYKKAGQTPKKVLRELRCSADFAGKFEVGGKVKLEDVFAIDQFVDVQGTTRGRGFTGVMRRWNFAGAVDTHGTHEYRRHGGSIGTNMTPGRTLPGLKMPGHYGSETVSTLNLRIKKVLPEEHLILVEGGVPGPRNSIVTVRGAVKKNGGKPAAKK